MKNIISFSDLVEKNGKTVRENNLTKTHKIPINTFIQLDCKCDFQFHGARLWVREYGRDCDGSPLYFLGFKDENYMAGGFGEESLVVLKDPS